MSDTDIRFSCPECGKPIRARAQLAGKGVRCPKKHCRKTIAVPQFSERTIRSDQCATAGGPPPSGMLPLVSGMVAVWGVVTVLIILAWILSRWGVAMTLLLLLPWSALAFGCVLRLLLAKVSVVGSGSRQEVGLFFGLAKLVAWKPNEGVVLLRNNEVSHLDDNPYDGGGMKLIYPVLGDELALRIPLEHLVLEFVDEEVLTREFIPVGIRGRIEWKIVNIESFYNHVGTEIQGLSDRRKHFDERTSKLDVAKHILTLNAEERTRTVVAQAATGLLVAQQIFASLPAAVRQELGDEPSTKGALASRSGATLPDTPSSSAEYRSATDGLAILIQQALDTQMEKYGILVTTVALQEVELPREIYAAANEACAAAYLPVTAQSRATARKIELLAEGEGAAGARKLMLQSEADVIGADNVATREIVGSAPAFALVDFLSQFFADFSKRQNFGRSQQR